MSDKAPATNKLFSYFMVGGLGAISAAGAKSTVEGRWRDRMDWHHSSTGAGQLMIPSFNFDGFES